MAGIAVKIRCEYIFGHEDICAAFKGIMQDAERLASEGVT